LGVIGLVINGLLFWLTSVIAGQFDLPFHVDGFWPGFWGAIIVAVVSFLLSIVIGPRDERGAR
jgi:putative membrane protein